MTPEKHQQRHKELHKMLDELVADYIDHNFKYDSKNKSLTETSVMDLMKWSSEQAIKPTEKKENS